MRRLAVAWIRGGDALNNVFGAILNSIERPAPGRQAAQ